MADDKSKRDFRDRALQLMKTKRSSISRTRRVSPQQVTELIAKHGNKRETLERELRLCEAGARMPWPVRKHVEIGRVSLPMPEDEAE